MKYYINQQYKKECITLPPPRGPFKSRQNLCKSRQRVGSRVLRRRNPRPVTMEKEKKSQLCRVPTSSCQVPKNDGKGNEKGNQYDPIPGYDVTDFEEKS